ncbi:MAG: DUF3383 family protein [Betaproteobacteria bacterium]|nr:MAG: DUF3383 family protein [Betaproteobacteria bacterium]
MGSVGSIVNVNVSRQTKTPSRAGFGTGAFLANDTTLTNLTKVYTSLAQMQEDTELTGSDALGAGASYFGQNFSAPKFTVIKEVSGVAQQSKITWDSDFVADNSIIVTLDGTPLTAVPFDTDQATTLAAVVAVIDAVSGFTVSASAGTSITVDNDTVDVAFSLSSAVSGGLSQPNSITQIIVQAGGLTGSLVNSLNETNDWYGLAIYARTFAAIEEVSDWIQGIGSANPKLFVGQSADVGILDPAVDTDIVSVLGAKSAFRTAIIYNADSTEFSDCGWMGEQLPKDPGSSTWAYKQISLSTPTDFAAGEKEAAHGKNCNTYDVVASTNITEEGKVLDGPSGEYIDIIRGVDWITVNVQADLFALIVQNPKIPYTSNGIGICVLTVRNTLKTAQNMGILSTDSEPVVTAPDIVDVPAADKANRLLNDLDFSAVLAGAIQKINVNGVVTL